MLEPQLQNAVKMSWRINGFTSNTARNCPVAITGFQSRPMHAFVAKIALQLKAVDSSVDSEISSKADHTSNNLAAGKMHSNTLGLWAWRTAAHLLWFSQFSTHFPIITFIRTSGSWQCPHACFIIAAKRQASSATQKTVSVNLLQGFVSNAVLDMKSYRPCLKSRSSGERWAQVQDSVK